MKLKLSVKELYKNAKKCEKNYANETEKLRKVISILFLIGQIKII
jgi:hypothetical protein